MKHSLRIIIWMVIFFFISQVIGLLVVSNYLSVQEVTKIDILTNETYLTNETVALDLPNNLERPQFDTSLEFISYLVIAILLTTMLFLFLIKLKTTVLWKFWFFIAVFLCLTISLAAFMPSIIATILGLFFALWKIFKPNVLVHNLTELFIYGGLAALLVPIPIVNVSTIIIVLVLISIYDAYSVWKSKHMVAMAQFQAKSKVFAGLLIPYKKSKLESTAPKKGKVMFKGIKTAILGGGDVAFPLLFAGTVMKSMLMDASFMIIFLKTLIIPLFTGLALFLLFMKGREDRFYPAMPFLTAGCLVGYGILLLVNSVF